MDTSGADDDNEASKLQPDGNENALDKPVSRPSTRGRGFSKLLAGIVAVSLAFIYTAWASFTYNDPANAGQCEMAWMSPGYLRLDGLDRNHSRLAGKYSLWMYREQGWDLSNKPHGVPVLFAPGNAGSYRQVRSLAAEAARSFYQSPGQPKQELLDEGSRELDFFAADFNEDFSAFHAATLREQAEYLVDALEYILGLYEDTPESPRPTSVIMLAHSMGGIATRLMLLQPKFRPDSIKTIVTLSTPHAIPPATFDAGIEKVYTEINEYWKQSYNSGNRLDDLLLVSIAGGTSDTTVSSDYSGISGFTPAHNGFTVFTTSVPSLFSPVDHLAMVWCDQLRKSVVQALLRSVDAKAASRSKSLPARMKAMKRYLTTGLEEPPQTPVFGVSHTFEKAEVAYQDNSALSLQDKMREGLYGLPIPRGSIPARFTLWTDAKPETLDVFACKQTLNELACQQVMDAAFMYVPTSSRSTECGTAIAIAKAHGAYLEATVPATFKTIVIQLHEPSEGFVYAQAASFSDGREPVSLVALALLGWRTILLPGDVTKKFSFPSMDTSLLAYELKVEENGGKCQTPPLLRAYSSEVHESIFYPKPTVGSIYLHSSPPFLPADSSGQGLSLQIWRDPQCELRISMQIDWFNSIGKLVLRYRSLVTAWPVLVVLLCLRIQLVASKEADTSVTFAQALSRFARLELPWLCGISACLSVLQICAVMAGYGGHSGAFNLLLGNSQLIFVGLAPLFLLTITSIVYMLHWLLTLLLHATAALWTAWSKFAPRRLSRNPTFTNVREQWVKTRIGTFAALALLILFFAPHQFAFLVLLLVQFDNAVRSLITYRASKESFLESRFNLNYTLLLSTVFLLPQNGAILLVWLRNLQAGWYAPFPSDHSILSVLGYLLLVEHGQTGKVLRLGGKAWLARMASALLLLSALVVLCYGARFAYLAGMVTNVAFVWLFVVQRL